jgi:hypothetical protein
MENKMGDFQRIDFIKAAKELNNLAGTKLKVVAIKPDVLKKAIQEVVPSLTNFDFSTLSPTTLDILDDLNCDMPEMTTEIAVDLVDSQIPEDFDEDELEPDNDDNEEVEEEKEDMSTDEALIAAAEDLIDVLGYDKNDIKKFKDLNFRNKIIELQKMADVINEPYKGDDGKMVTPEDKPEDFKPETVAVFEANGIKIKWSKDKKVEEKPKGEGKKNPVVEIEVSKKKEETTAVKTKNKPKTKPAVKADKKEKKYTRINAFCDVLNEKTPLTKAEINYNMNQLYGGEPRDQTGNINFMITPLIEFGLVEVSGEGKAATYCLK